MRIEAGPTRGLEHSDEVLMERFCQGDSTAFDALFVRHGRSVHGYLTRLVRDPELARDLTQATFLSLVRGRSRFAQGARFKPWLFAIATNAARDAARRKRPEDPTPHEALTAVGDEPQALPDPGLERRVREALEQLPENQREAIILHRFEHLSFADIAQAVGASESAVKVRAHRGYERLRQLLGDLWEDA